MIRSLTQHLASHRFDKWFGLGMVGVNAVFRVTFSVLLARFGGPDLFAIYVSLLTVEVIVNSLLSARYVTPLCSLAPGLADADRAAFVQYALRRNRGGAALVIALVVAAASIAVPLGVGVATYVAFCAYLLVWLLANATGGALSAEFRNARGAIADVMGFGIQLTGLLTAHACGWPLLTVFFAAGFVGHGLGFLFMATGLPRARGLVVATELAERFERMGRAVVAGSIANSACSRTQPFVLGSVGGALAISMFGAAQTFVGPVRTFGSALGEVLRPRLALFRRRNDDTESRRAMAVSLAGLFVVVLVLCVMFLTAGEWLAVTIMGPAFADLAVVLPWALLFATLGSVVTLLVVAMQTEADDGAAVASKWRIVVAVVSLVFVWPACAYDGARGAFAAMSIAEGVFLVAALRFLRGCAVNTTTVAVTA